MLIVLNDKDKIHILNVQIFLYLVCAHPPRARCSPGTHRQGLERSYQTFSRSSSKVTILSLQTFRRIHFDIQVFSLFIIEI